MKDLSVLSILSPHNHQNTLNALFSKILTWRGLTFRIFCKISSFFKLSNKILLYTGSNFILPPPFLIFSPWYVKRISLELNTQIFELPPIEVLYWGSENFASKLVKQNYLKSLKFTISLSCIQNIKLVVHVVYD